MSYQFVVIRKIVVDNGAFMDFSHHVVHYCNTDDEVHAIITDFGDDEFTVARLVKDTRFLTVDEYHENVRRLETRRPWRPGPEGLPTCSYCGSCEWDHDSTGLGELQEHIREKHESTPSTGVKN